ncbi:MAG: NINE protein [Clostridia bacterium]|nr:NINE protein [Clostridia bacterium]
MPEAIGKSVITVIGTLVGGFSVGFGLTGFDFSRILRRERKPAPDRNFSENAAVSKTCAAVLAFLLGGLGVHRYYLGYKKQGAAQTCGFISLVGAYTYCVTQFVSGYKPSVGEAVLPLFLVLYGAAVSIWAFVDFIRILTGSLQPANGNPYSENLAQQVWIAQQKEKASDVADAIGKIAKLHEQGVLTDEEFQKKKAELLAKMG